MLKASIAVVTALVASLLAAGQAFAGTPEISSNWSGYVAVAADGAAAPTFSDVTGTWIQPRATCSSGRSDAAAFWVGLGGNSSDSQALEQLGTSVSCDGNSSTPTYEAWWEIVPAASVPIRLKIRPGDRINAAVLVNGQTVTMSLKNLTRHTRFAKTKTLTQPLDVSSAEWIAEAPSDCTPSGRCKAVPLTQFGNVTFTNAAAIGNAHAGTITDPAWAPIQIELISDGATSRFFGTSDPLGPAVGALPSDVSADGRSFSVSWQPNLSP
ncbi:MAG TPA: G1 family glutamic endopeptidase [Gaiellaceae bacterium]|nr:G1 family glutamic endopeptidase [Gaiellaceae bacterium]